MIYNNELFYSPKIIDNRIKIQKRRLLLLSLLIISLTTAVDYYMKYYLIYHMEWRADIPITSFLDIFLLRNSGIAFSMFSTYQYAPMLIAWVVGLSLLLLFFYLLSQRDQPMIVYSLSFVIGGGIGNFIDRVMYGSVLDFIDFHLYGYHFPTFNFADCFVFIGGVSFLIATMRSEDFG